MILTHEHQARHKRTKNLSKYVTRDLLPREALPIRKAQRDSLQQSASATPPSQSPLTRIKMPPRRRRTRNNRKRDPNSVRPTNHEQ